MREDLSPAEELFQPGFALRRGAAAVGRLALVVVLSGWISGFDPATAAHAQIGTSVADVELATLDGGRARLLADVAANVLVFFRPDQERSLKTLKDLAGCQKPFAGKSVRWIGVVSGAASRDDARAAVTEARLAMPFLVDEGDALYGSLGVALHPVVVVVGADRKLAAFEPFRAINYCLVITARIRRVLGEISDDEMQRLLAPPRTVDGGDAQAAARNLRLAQALFEAKRYDNALVSVRRSLEKDPALAGAHALMGEILARQGNCAEAVRAFAKAIEIDAGSVRAKEGLQQCERVR